MLLNGLITEFSTDIKNIIITKFTIMTLLILILVNTFSFLVVFFLIKKGMRDHKSDPVNYTKIYYKRMFERISN